MILGQCLQSRAKGYAWTVLRAVKNPLQRGLERVFTEFGGRRWI